jgi:hypothetical protein
MALKLKILKAVNISYNPNMDMKAAMKNLSMKLNARMKK